MFATVPVFDGLRDEGIAVISTTNLEVKNPKPVSTLIEMMNKFRYVSDKEIQEIQDLVSRKYNTLKALAAML